MPSVEYRQRNLARLRAYNTAYMRRYRLEHPGRSRASQERVYAVARAFYDALKAGPCTDCGATYPPFVMDFDHVRGEKRLDVSKLRYVRIASRSELLAEVAKCDLVCANCHRLRTMKGRGGPLDYRLIADALR